MRRLFLAALLLCACATPEQEHRKLGYTPLPAGGGGTTTITADTSAMPSTSSGSLLAYMRTPGFVGAADSLMPQSSQVIGVLSAGTLIGGTQIVSDLQFTAQGGKPANGAPFWLAGADEDSSTGQGKATATMPDVGVPFPDYPQVIVRSRVLLGTVLDNNKFDSNGTCVVQIKLPAGPVPPSNPGFGWDGFEAEPFTATKEFHVDGNQPQLGWAIGETVAILFTIENTSSFGNEYLWANFDAGFTNGWALHETSGHILASQFSASGVDADMGTVAFGLHCAVATIAADSTAHGGTIRASIDGGRVVTHALGAAVSAPSSGWTMTIGGVHGLSDQWAAGGIVSVYKLGRTLSDLELQQYSGIPTPKQPPNYLYGRWIMHPTMAEDGSVQWYWRALDWSPSQDPIGVIGPSGGSGISFSTAPSAGAGPGKVSKHEQLYTNLAPYILDTDPVAVDSLGYPHGEPGQRIAFTAPSGQDMIGVGFENDDFDGHDIMAPTFQVDGVPMANTLIPVTSDGLIHWVWERLPLSAEGSHHIEIVVPANDSHVFAGGRATTGTKIPQIIAASHTVFDTPATSSRLVLLDEGPMAGHDSSNESMLNSTTFRLRADYPGRVTICGNSAMAISGLYTWGGNSMMPYVRQVMQCAAEGNPSSVILYVALGFYDYSIALDRPASWGVKYGQLLDGLHAAIPGATIWLQKFIASHTLDNVANGNGDTMAQFETVLDALTAGRSWVHLIDARLPNALTYAGSTSNYFIQAPSGTQAYHDNIRATGNGGPVY